MRAREVELVQLQDKAFMGATRFSLNTFQRGLIELVKDIL